MINLRVRDIGEEEWTYLDLSGEHEEGLESFIVATLLSREMQVQKCNEEGDYEDWGGEDG